MRSPLAAKTRACSRPDITIVAVPPVLTRALTMWASRAVSTAAIAWLWSWSCRTWC